VESRQLVAHVAEMQDLFDRLGEHETLESESEGRVRVVTLLRLALRSELEASELAGMWMPTTPEVDAKLLLARQCGEEMSHYQQAAAEAARCSLAIADELRTVSEKSTRMHPIPVS
jgi:hypothetical protein